MPKLAKNIVGNLIKLPPNMANAGWDIDVDVLRSFCREFGITRDVHIRWNSSHRTGGTHRGKVIAGKLTHCITISQVVEQSKATHIMLHELCHAIQAERYATDAEFDREYRREVSLGARNYLSRNSFEIEAETFAFENAEKWSNLLY